VKAKPRFKLRLSDELALLIRQMHPVIKKKVRAALAAIQHDPSCGKALKDDLAPLISFRTGRLRIVYEVSEKELRIVAVGPRSRIYEETLRLINSYRPFPATG
jgi:mRNA interferase RelE/StbE